MPSGSARIYKFRPPGGMPPDSFNRLLTIGGIIVFLFLFSFILQKPSNLMESMIGYLMLIPIILISLTFHEYCHALMADFLGDPTPRRMGRLSLNPLRHLDPIGAMMLFFTHFGWAKPVLVDPRNFRIPKRAMLSVALAGPASNLFLASVGALLLKLLAFSMPYIAAHPIFILLTYKTIQLFIVINLSLAIFNLLPLPPLDGSRIVSFFMPDKYRLQYRSFEEVAPFILLILFMVGGLGPILHPLISFGYSFLLGAVGNPQSLISLQLLSATGSGMQL